MDILNLSSGETFPGKPMRQARQKHSIIILRGYGVIAIGGVAGKKVLSSCEAFDFALERWSLRFHSIYIYINDEY